MKALKSTAQILSDARQLEQSSRLTEAAALYQQLVDADPTDPQAMPRLLTLYRRLKEPKKELAVIENALAVYIERQKTVQEKWISAHPQAARAGRAFLRSLGGSSVSASDSNPAVSRLLKRREIVEKKLQGKHKSSKKPVAKVANGKTIAATAAQTPAAAAKSAAAKKTAAARKAAAAAKEKRAEERRKAAEQKRQAAEKKRQAAEARKQAAQQKKAEANATRKAAAIAPSLFIISLRYLASLEKIDALAPKHRAFLDKHFAAGDFLTAGHQVPRTGDVLIARGKNRAEVERIINQDPFLKNKLASVDIIEFTPDKLTPSWRPQKRHSG